MTLTEFKSWLEGYAQGFKESPYGRQHAEIVQRILVVASTISETQVSLPFPIQTTPEVYRIT